MQVSLSPKRSTTVFRLLIVAFILLAAFVVFLANKGGNAHADTAATISVNGSPMGVSTQYIGTNTNPGADGSANNSYNSARLKEVGFNSMRIWNDITQFEPTDDSSTYGSPSISQIKAAGTAIASNGLIPWSTWDSNFQSYKAFFDQVKSDNIRLMISLNTHAGSDSWFKNQPPSTDADWNEWWEHVFAEVYWLNVRNNYHVDDWEVFNEPDLNWKGTTAQYATFVHYTSDAIRYLYSTFLPGRTPYIYASTLSYPQVAANGQSGSWQDAVFSAVGNEFNAVSYHYYHTDGEFSNGINIAHSQANNAGHSDYPVWITEWGSYDNSTYAIGQNPNCNSDPSCAVEQIDAMIRGSQPGNSYLYGSEYYWWASAGYGDSIFDTNNNPRTVYYALREGIRALQGGKTTFQSTPSTSDLNSITTKDSSGAIYLLTVNTSGTNYSVNEDVSGLYSGSTSTTYLYRYDASNADSVTNGPAISSGHVSFSIPAHGSVLIQIGGTPAAAHPSLFNVSPGYGPTGTTVTLNGANFGITQGSSTVKFGSTTASVSSWSDTKIVATVPSGLSAGSTNVTVVINGTATNAALFTVTAPGGGIAINAGGGAAGSFIADTSFSGGSPASTTDTIDTSGVTNPAPQAVYQTNRFGASTYTLTSFTPGASYKVRLHFAESYWKSAGSRVFNVSINGTQVLNNFDIYAAAGFDKAVVKEFNVTAASNGQIVIQFSNVTDQAQINGIEVIGSGSNPTPTPTPTNTPTPTPTPTATPTSGGALNRSNWVASASTTNTAEWASRAIDGDLTTRYSTGTGQASGQWFQVDMGSAQSFNKLVLDATNAAGDYPRGYQVFVSNDGSNWGSAIASGSGSGAITTITFSTQNARYVRVTLTASSGSWWSIDEFNAYAPNSGGGGSGPLNRSSWTASASTTNTAEWASRAIDGDLTTRYSTGTGQASGQWFQVDMGSTQSFSKLVLDATNASGDYPRGYQVFVSNDGSTWGNAIASGSGSGAITTITFPAQNARYVRVTLTASASSWWSIDEFNAYS